MKLLVSRYDKLNGAAKLDPQITYNKRQWSSDSFKHICYWNGPRGATPALTLQNFVSSVTFFIFHSLKSLGRRPCATIQHWPLSWNMRSPESPFSYSFSLAVGSFLWKHSAKTEDTEVIVNSDVSECAGIRQTAFATNCMRNMLAVRKAELEAERVRITCISSPFATANENWWHRKHPDWEMLPVLYHRSRRGWTSWHGVPDSLSYCTGSAARYRSRKCWLVNLSNRLHE